MGKTFAQRCQHYSREYSIRPHYVKKFNRLGRQTNNEHFPKDGMAVKKKKVIKMACPCDLTTTLKCNRGKCNCDK